MDLFEYAAAQESPRERYERLCATVRRNNELYYAKATPEISDAEYDRLYREIEDIEREHPDFITPDSPTQKVGNDLSEGFRKVTHPAPMQSIDDIFEHKPEQGETDAELIEFYTRLEEQLGQRAPKVVVEPKIDGCAVTLLYRNGKLAYAATRGDGRTGDDITANVRTMKDVPFTLPAGAPELLEVRGEIFMPSADFDRMNEERDADGLPAFANPRNATAGTIKLLDPAEVARRPLRFLAHGIGVTEGVTFRTMEDYESLLSRMGIPYNTPILRAEGTDAVRAAVAEIDRVRRTLGFGTDGAVIKLDDFSSRAALGSTARAPRWAAAFKYLPEQKETVLKAITIQVGRTGVLTPVAELEPVKLSGTTVSRATLHNADEIERKDIRVGDTLLMEKSGEIIPAVVHVVKEKRPADALPYNLYEAVGGVCPCCGAPIAQEEGQVAWRCTNLTCPAQAAMRTTYFCKREALDIENLGGTVAEALVNRGLIATPLDLFRLSLEELGALNLGTDEEPRRFGEKNAAKALAALEKAKTMPLERWLTAFGIPTIGKTTAAEIAAHFTDLDTIAHAEELRAVYELQPVLRVYNYFSRMATKRNSETEAMLPANTLPTILEKWRLNDEFWAMVEKHSPTLHQEYIKLSAQFRPDGYATKETHDKMSKVRKEAKKLITQQEKAFYKAYVAETAHNKEELEAIQESLRPQLMELAERAGFPVISGNELKSSSAGQFCLVAKQNLYSYDYRGPFGTVSACNLHLYFRSKAGEETLARLKALGITPVSETFGKKGQIGEGPLNGKTFVLTGALSRPRPEFEKMIAAAGGKATGSVTKNTDYLVAGEGGGSKREKAAKLGVPVISEQELSNMMQASATPSNGMLL